MDVSLGSYQSGEEVDAHIVLTIRLFEPNPENTSNCLLSPFIRRRFSDKGPESRAHRRRERVRKSSIIAKS